VSIESASKVLRETIASLIESDGGELYLVTLKPNLLEIHLAGCCSGCPGSSTTLHHVVEPLVRAAGFSGQIRMTLGPTMPATSVRVYAHDPQPPAT
jgi:Fe-S cluster biogenesis protein NfuA